MIQKIKDFITQYRDGGLNSVQALGVVGVVLVLFFVVAYVRRGKE